MIAIHTRPKGSWRHMRYQLGENRPTRQHAVFCLGEPEGRFSAENRDLPKISLRGNNPRMSCAVNMLQRFTPTMTGHYWWGACSAARTADCSTTREVVQAALGERSAGPDPRAVSRNFKSRKQLNRCTQIDEEPEKGTFYSSEEWGHFKRALTIAVGKSG